MFITLHDNPGNRPFPINMALVVTYSAFDSITKNDVVVNRTGTLISSVGGASYKVKETPEEIEVLLQAAGLMASNG